MQHLEWWSAFPFQTIFSMFLRSSVIKGLQHALFILTEHLGVYFFEFLSSAFKCFFHKLSWKILKPVLLFLCN